MSDPRHAFRPIGVVQRPIVSAVCLRQTLRAALGPRGLPLPDLIAIFAEEARSVLGPQTAHALAQDLERSLDHA